MSHESRDDVMATLAMANFLAHTQGVPKAKNGQTSGQRLFEHAYRTIRAGNGDNASQSKKLTREWSHPNSRRLCRF